ncbi:MAG: helix-turn-helix transcriptional regulator [Bulleidia sp.]
MKEGKLTFIILQLLNRRKVSARYLAEKLEVSVRSVYRYIDELYALGIPVIAEKGRNGGIRIDDSYVLRAALFTPQEKQQLLTALQAGKDITDRIPQTLIDKVTALFQGNRESVIEVNLKRWGKTEHENDRFHLLHDACLTNHAVAITYASSQGTVSERTVYPLSLLYHTSAWYLRAYCTLRNDFRMFRLTRILSMEVLPETFSPMTCPKTEEYSPVETEVSLLFDQSVSYRVYDDFDLSMIRKQSDGSLLVMASMPYDPWLISYVLSFGAKVQVLSPIGLKEDVRKEIQKMIHI